MVSWLLLLLLAHSGQVSARELKQAGCSEFEQGLSATANSASFKAGVAQACARRKLHDHSHHSCICRSSCQPSARTVVVKPSSGQDADVG